MSTMYAELARIVIELKISQLGWTTTSINRPCIFFIRVSDYNISILILISTIYICSSIISTINKARQLDRVAGADKVCVCVWVFFTFILHAQNI